MKGGEEMSQPNNNNDNNPSTGALEQNPISAVVIPPPIPSGPEFRTLKECFSLNTGTEIENNETND